MYQIFIISYCYRIAVSFLYKLKWEVLATATHIYSLTQEEWLMGVCGTFLIMNTSMYVAYYNGITKFEIIKVCRYSILIKMVAIKEIFKRFYPKLS